LYAAFDVDPEVGDRIRHVAHLGVRTRDFAFVTNGLDAPATEFRAALTAPLARGGPGDPRTPSRR